MNFLLYNIPNLRNGILHQGAYRNEQNAILDQSLAVYSNKANSQPAKRPWPFWPFFILNFPSFFNCLRSVS